MDRVSPPGCGACSVVTTSGVGRRQAVGIAQGVMGVFGAASGVPAGFIADRTRRDKTLRGFGIVQLGERRMNAMLSIL